MNAKRIAIIGAGFRGVGCLKVLKHAGYQVDVFEGNDDVGGVWHPSNNYKGLTIHTPAKLNQFFDFPFPPHIDLTQRLPSKDIFQYLKSYCEHFALYPHIRFNTKVRKIQYNSKTNTSTLILADNKGEEFVTQEYDYMINTNGYCDKHIPHFEGSDKFSGSIIHSFDANEDYLKSAIASQKRITVLGGSKTATDLAASLAKMGCEFTWLYRKSYWFLRFNPLQEYLKSAYDGKGGHYIYKILMLIGFMIGNLFPRITGWLWRTTNIIDTYGERHSDYKKFHVAYIDDSNLELLKECNKRLGVCGEIQNFDSNGYYLKDGRYIESDIIICCTGSSGTKSFIDVEVDHEKLDIDSIFRSYRGSVIPQVPNMIFTAYHHFVMGLCDGELQAQWIMNYIESRLDSKFVTDHSLHYDHPFFTKLVLFDSTAYYLPSFMKMQFDYIFNREIGPIEYVKFIYDFFFKTEHVQPLKIYNPWYLPVSVNLPPAEKPAHTRRMAVRNRRTRKTTLPR